MSIEMKTYFPNQIVYNLEDYANSGELVTSVRPDGKKIQIFKDEKGKDILAQMEINGIYHLGIQAPPGTKFAMRIRGSKEFSNFMIGRTGIYELADDIPIDCLYFIRPKKFVLDESATENMLQVGTNLMWNAKQNLDNSTDGLSLLNDNYHYSKEDWEVYQQAHKEYVTNYEAGRYKYMQGIGGVYVESALQSDLYNIIIDYLSIDEKEGV